MRIKLNPEFPVIQRIKKTFILKEDVWVFTDDRGLLIPKGYTFDGHSVPGFLHGVFDPGKKDVVAALVHDYLYESMKELPWSRQFADAAYKSLMNDERYKTNNVRATLFPAVVKIAGWLYYYT